jgi:outer membrane protein assembly factor BamE (lipoprotein component of BamABCDE complex)
MLIITTFRATLQGAVVIGAMALSGCASFPSHIEPGMSREQVLARFGTPSVDVTAPDHEVLIYSTAPFGELAYAAVLDENKTVTRLVQVLSLENFARIEPHVWTKQIILNNFGIPAQKRNIRGNETWDYRYRENDVYYSLYTVTFDDSGVVIKTENGPDPMHDGGRDGGHH